MLTPARSCLLSLLACAVSATVAAAQTAPACPASGVVLVANGAGDLRHLTKGMTRAVSEARAPLAVETVLWSHGSGRYFVDLTDPCRHREAGLLLAGHVANYRRYYPHLRISLVGHSAGCAIILAAAEALPPGTVDRIVLLQPAVSPCYDLRPALACAREGVDVFISDRDWLVLGLGTAVLGTTDGKRGPAAGKVGFQAVVCNAHDAALYARLRQHHWHPSARAAGHNGGHGDSQSVLFIRSSVLPLVLPQ